MMEGASPAIEPSATPQREAPKLMAFNLDDEVEHRRRVLNDYEYKNGNETIAPPGSDAKWGLALSGGGIRSATFSLGVLRGLAHRKVLSRFDLLSTVSGGGYIGAMLGRLYARASGPADAKEIQTKLGGSQTSWFIWWLRANGRYLAPQGVKEMTFALAVYVRNLIAIHLELSIIALLLGCFLVSFDLTVWRVLDLAAIHHPPAFGFLRSLSPWLPTFWLLLAPVTFYAGSLSASHWAITWLAKTSSSRTLFYWSLCFVAWLFLCATYYLYALLPEDDGSTLRAYVWSAILLLFLVWLVGVPIAARQLRQASSQVGNALKIEDARSKLTKRLAVTFGVFGIVVVLGVLDRLAWFLSFEFEQLMASGALLGILVAIARVLLPLWAKPREGAPAQASYSSALNVFGYVMVFAVTTWWVSIAHRVVLGAIFGAGQPNYLNALTILAGLSLPLIAYFLATGRNFAFLNLSSLHAFYRARLVRTYLGASNATRFLSLNAKPLDVLQSVPLENAHQHAVVSVKDTHPQDDIGMRQYRPQDVGGPVHLINVCVNQTVDPRGQIFNQDRKGVPMTVASGGAIRVALERWSALDEDQAMTLGTWVAISGAAVSSGMGALTSGGAAALTTLTGLRLGYWWTRSASLLGLRRWSKALSLLEETVGAFTGTTGNNWYLSDGGHFENTAAYALLAARAEVIVLVDCGADPSYSFGDLENLVRKARIDLQTDICFMRHAKEKLAERQKHLSAFGSLSEIASQESSACLALAEVYYRGPNSGKGILILVKPNVHNKLQVDLRNYKRANPLFPQESTADQFFSENQWESYFSLGQHLGCQLDKHLITDLLKNKDTYFAQDESSPLEQEQLVRGAQAEPISSTPSIRTPASTVKTTLGLGAIATLGVSVWQGIDGWQTSQKAQVASERAALTELTQLWQETPTEAVKTSAAEPPASVAKSDSGEDEVTTDAPAISVSKAPALASVLLRHAEYLCKDDSGGWFKKSPLAHQIYRQTIAACQRGPANNPCTELLKTENPEVFSPYPSCLAKVAAYSPRLNRLPTTYWIYDYSLQDNVLKWHPCDPSKTDAVLKQSVGCKMADAMANASDKPTMLAWLEGMRAAGWVKLRETLRQHAPILASAPDDGDTSSQPSLSTSPTIPAPSASSPVTPAWPNVPSGLPLVPESQSVCLGKTAYLQIYGPGDRAKARDLRNPWRRMGASVPTFEDVLATSAARGIIPPRTVTQNTIRFHTLGDQACAEAMAKAAQSLFPIGWTTEPLSPRLQPTPGVIEVWIKPGALSSNHTSQSAASTVAPASSAIAN